MKRISIVVLITFLAGCGGGNQESTPVTQQAPIAPVVVPGPTVVFIGDSITSGLGELPHGYINAGVPSEVTADMLARFDTDVMAHHPKVVVILGGTNDIRRFAYPTTDSIATMADRSQASGACVVIGLVPPDSVWTVNPDVDAAWGKSSTTTFNASLVTLARSFGYFVADRFSAMSLPDGSINPDLFYDGIHPSAKGNEVMLGVIEPQIEACRQRLGV